jgi:hypothetical protein
MLRIRKEQMDILGEYMLKKFENYMVVHLRHRFAERLKGTPEEAIRAIVQKGISKANCYDIRIEYDVERYIDLMFILGDDFDTAEKTLWAGELLRNNKMLPRKRINGIYNHLEVNP